MAAPTWEFSSRWQPGHLLWACRGGCCGRNILQHSGNEELMFKKKRQEEVGECNSIWENTVSEERNLRQESSGKTRMMSLSQNAKKKKKPEFFIKYRWFSYLSICTSSCSHALLPTLFIELFFPYTTNILLYSTGTGHCVTSWAQSSVTCPVSHACIAVLLMSGLRFWENIMTMFNLHTLPYKIPSICLPTIMAHGNNTFLYCSFIAYCIV